jgi:hypothetical protein
MADRKFSRREILQTAALGTGFAIGGTGLSWAGTDGVHAAQSTQFWLC